MKFYVKTNLFINSFLKKLKIKKEKKNFKRKLRKKEGITFFLYFLLFFSLCAELAYAMVVTKKCDVYSFGVLALEIFIEAHLGELDFIIINNPKYDVK